MLDFATAQRPGTTPARGENDHFMCDSANMVPSAPGLHLLQPAGRLTQFKSRLFLIYFPAMNRTLKTLLLWLLMAVLPLNAVAAAMGMSCSAVHDRAASVHTADHLSHDHASASKHPAAGDHAAHQADGHAASAQQDAAPDTGHGQGHSTCGACSAFCLGAGAPPPAVIPAVAPAGSEIVLVSPAPNVASVIPDRDKRPPRHFSA